MSLALAGKLQLGRDALLLLLLGPKAAALAKQNGIGAHGNVAAADDDGWSVRSPNDITSSDEVFSSDEDSTSDEDSSIDEDASVDEDYATEAKDVESSDVVQQEGFMQQGPGGLTREEIYGGGLAGRLRALSLDVSLQVQEDVLATALGACSRLQVRVGKRRGGGQQSMLMWFSAEIVAISSSFVLLRFYVTRAYR
jgi:hypothetical protein